LRARQGAGTWCAASRAELAGELVWPVATVDGVLRRLVDSGLVVRRNRQGFKNQFSVRGLVPPSADAVWTLPEDMRPT
jgi:hypothetical protein